MHVRSLWSIVFQSPVSPWPFACKFYPLLEVGYWSPLQFLCCCLFSPSVVLTMASHIWVLWYWKWDIARTVAMSWVSSWRILTCDMVLGSYLWSRGFFFTFYFCVDLSVAREKLLGWNRQSKYKRKTKTPWNHSIRHFWSLYGWQTKVFRCFMIFLKNFLQLWESESEICFWHIHI